jgi:hypothetical protein
MSVSKSLKGSYRKKLVAIITAEIKLIVLTFCGPKGMYTDNRVPIYIFKYRKLLQI